MTNKQVRPARNVGTTRRALRWMMYSILLSVVLYAAWIYETDPGDDAFIINTAGHIPVEHKAQAAKHLYFRNTFLAFQSISNTYR